MNIFLQELKANRKALFFWCFGMILMVSSGMAKYGGYKASGQSVNQLISTLPKAVRAILGFGELDLSKASGYFGVLFIYLIILATIHAALLGADIISKEERDKTSEFLFVKPISRLKIITSKLLAALFNVVVLNIITLLSSVAIVDYYNKGPSVNTEIYILMLAMFLLQLIFLAIGIVMAAISKNPRVATTKATSILLATFILSVIIDLSSKIEKLKYLTPFKYFEAKDLIKNLELDPVFVFLSLIIIIFLTCSTYLFYQRRDLSI
ncbi:MAG: ABC transporter [Actinobacteria bacterium]|nr:MAG: ABC transporter [Actinomycetota bacterium]